MFLDIKEWGNYYKDEMDFNNSTFYTTKAGLDFNNSTFLYHKSLIWSLFGDRNDLWVYQKK